ncbi:MAG: hypothetical protein WKG03_11025, partial [Telluria sp.]
NIVENNIVNRDGLLLHPRMAAHALRLECGPMSAFAPAEAGLRKPAILFEGPVAVIGQPSYPQPSDWTAMKSRITMMCALALFSHSGASAQGLFKCVQDGKTAYQAEPCAVSAKQDTLKYSSRAPAASAATSAFPTGATQAGTSPEVNRLVEFMSTYHACANAIQIWRQEMAGPYQDWRSRNVAAVTQIEKDTRLQARFQELVAAKRNGKAGMCRDVALELRGKK